MEVLLGEGIRFIIYLQNALSGFAKEMLFLSRVGDPKNSFLIYFPVSYHLDQAVGLMVLWVAVLSEWLNLTLKWFLRGERPYWWVHESDDWKDAPISQYPLTCETGPGSPSGHAMVTTSVLFTMMPLVARQLSCLLKTEGPLQRTAIRIFLWFVFLLVVALVSLSRLFIATHFPHQVIGGIFGGIAISYMTQQNLLLSNFLSVTKCSIVSMALVLLSLTFYSILSYAIFDPSESVQKAQKWCADPAYIHVETTPFYALVRDAGAVLGIGLAHWLVRLCNPKISVIMQSVSSKTSPSSKNGFLSIFLNIILSITFIQALETLNLSFRKEIIIYIAGYVKNVTLVIIVVFITPSIIGFIRGDGKSKPKAK